MMVETVGALEANDSVAAEEALKHEDAVDEIEIDCRKAHAARLARGKCSVQAGMVLLDVIANLGEIADHLANIDQAVMGAFQWGAKHQLRDEEAPAEAQVAGDDGDGGDGGDGG